MFNRNERKRIEAQSLQQWQQEQRILREAGLLKPWILTDKDQVILHAIGIDPEQPSDEWAV